MWSITPYQPAPQLSSAIHLYWIGKVMPGAVLPTILLPPTGYASVLLQYGQNPLRLRNYGGPWFKVSKAVVMGQYFRYLETEIPDCFEVIGVLIKPAFLHQHFGINMHELTHLLLPADDVFGSDVLRLVDCIGNETSPSEKLNMVDAFFTNIIRSKKFETGIVDHALQLIHLNKGITRVKDLSDSFNCSSRLIQRKFKDITGVSPKYMGRVIQFNNALNILKAFPTTTWTDLAARTGYYDQAHLINAFIEFTGSSPVQYSQSDNDMSKFYLDSYDGE